MPTPDASRAGTFAIGGDMRVNRLGFGAMRVTGAGIWGPPADPDEARRTLRRLPELNIDFVDTAEAYGPYVSEDLIAEVLAPYGKLHIATKGGHTRQGPNRWAQVGRPEFLMQGVKTSLLRLKLDRLDLWQLHRIDPKVPAAEQFGTIAEMQKQGLIRHAGLSEVGVEEIKAAQKFFPVVSVQNKYSISDRNSDAVLSYCEANGIGFIPWRPIDGGSTNAADPKFQALLKKYGATPGQLSLAWLLKRSPVMLPIPGTGKVAHLEENIAAAAITLSDEDFATLSSLR
ncbi:MAG: oxidoreductase [Devosia sp. 67-54]|uniref:aldo/keto reductase n=1 Tax=unclassified Devosia TaxID=196773 RepID=UPI00095F0152|nr:MULTISPECIES: aldo/keto reductase [unclassified Devosia]MBN9307308.1 aldo/keto reductase [Devosia sp.]OJX19773.1 MAG: oxidoreductase [Devosia sp. 67-54]